MKKINKKEFKSDWRNVSGQNCLLAEGDIGAPIAGRGFDSFTLYISRPDSSVRFAYFHANCLLTGLYK
jgi:hypothetical protein